jgi:heat shock protein HslJ
VPTAAPTNSLNDTGWLLGTLHGQAVMPGTQVTLNFANDRFNGTDGCNQYNGSYTVAGEKITVGENIAATMMACEEPVAKQAAAYIVALRQAAVYKITGQQLTLLDADSKALATFRQSLELTDKDPRNATYLIDGLAITLVDGVAEVEAAPGSASKQVTRYLGNAVDIDLNGDGAMDSAFLLMQDSGGSGTAYFVVAALNTPDGYVGTNAIFIGDRIAPQSTVIDPNDPTQFIVNYADRKADEPMSAQPSQGISKWFKLKGDMLVEVTSPAQTP